MGPEQMIVLRAGMPLASARKIVHWQERAFQSRGWPAPGTTRHPAAIARMSGAGGPQEDGRGISPGGAGTARPAGRDRRASSPIGAPDISDEEVDPWLGRLLER